MRAHTHKTLSRVLEKMVHRGRKSVKSEKTDKDCNFSPVR